MNKVQLLGRLTRDPEVRYTNTDNSSMIVGFNVAVDRRFTNKNGERETDFINVSAFGKTAELIANYFKKGNRILVLGRINTRNWEDDKGVRHYVTEVVAEEIEFVDYKKDSNSSYSNSSVDNSNPFENSSAINDLDATDFTVNSENDLPF